MPKYSWTVSTTLLVLWYGEARKQGEPADPVTEELIAEAVSENN